MQGRNVFEDCRQMSATSYTITAKILHLRFSEEKTHGSHKHTVNRNDYMILLTKNNTAVEIELLLDSRKDQ